tara:strand:- start:10333 stop:11313 length:981 start_codon:yes stop_codon:yes gene_type:complete
MAQEDIEISKSLEHPRRSLGNRFRSQAEKFLKIQGSDPNNLRWAEQSARQSVLYDFTNEENWKILMRIKVMTGDSEGAKSVLEDVFSVLGRDPELMSQLGNVEISKSSEDLLHAVFSNDPLDPDLWWSKIGINASQIEDFSERLKTLDVSDYRANLIYSRRIERVRQNGNEELFLELSRHLLAQRPKNHEAWEELGRMYERRGEYDEAWLCYDQSQAIFPESRSRDRFKQRMADSIGGEESIPWRAPSISDRKGFLDSLRNLSTKEKNVVEMDGSVDYGSSPFSEIDDLRSRGKLSEAFFLARRMATEGEEGAEDIVSELLGELDG